MAAPVPLRLDFDAEALRGLAKGSRDPAQTHRLLGPVTLPVPAPVIRPTAAERRDAVREHDIEALRLLGQMNARHDSERRTEAATRRELQRDAALNWQALAFRPVAVAFLAKWSAYLAQAWRATHPDTANDNTPGRTPPRMGPRPL